MGASARGLLLRDTLRVASAVMGNKSIVAPEEQGATHVELFFDLVFVFALSDTA